MPRSYPLLQLVDDLAAEGIESFTARELAARTAVSPQVASNALRRLIDSGLVDRVSRGHYVLRPLGRLGTSAAAEDIAVAVGVLLAAEPHRIAYRSALDLQALLVHPARSIQVAAVRRVQVTRLSGRALRIVHERESTIRIGAERLTAGAWVSGHERALLDAAARPGLAGGASVLVEALAARAGEVEVLVELAERLNAWPALRRLGSLADTLEIGWLQQRLTPPSRGGEIALDPSGPAQSEWRDWRWRVRWPMAPQELGGGLQA